MRDRCGMHDGKDSKKEGQRERGFHSAKEQGSNLGMED